MQNSVKYSIGDGSVYLQYFIPIGYGNLAYNDCCLSRVPVFNDFHKIKSLLSIQFFYGEVVDYEQVHPCHLIEETRQHGFHSSEGNLFEKFLYTIIFDFKSGQMYISIRNYSTFHSKSIPLTSTMDAVKAFIKNDKYVYETRDNNSELS